ncbi:ciliary microtubule inner protein 6 [Morphnus guianensis]
MYRYTPPNYRAPKELIFRNESELISLAEFSQQQPSCGIVLLATPRASKGLPEIFQEQTSFSHQYNARDSANEPIRGKKNMQFTEAKKQLRCLVLGEDLLSSELL